MCPVEGNGSRKDPSAPFVISPASPSTHGQTEPYVQTADAIGSDPATYAITFRSSSEDESEASELPALEVIRWRDAFFDFDEPEEYDPDYQVVTVGFLVRESDVFVTIAQEVLPSGGFRAITHIPAATILERETFG